MISKRRLVLVSVPLFIAILSLPGISHGASAQTLETPLVKAGVDAGGMTDPAPLQSEIAGTPLPAGALFTSASKPGLFEDMRGSVGSQTQTKEWEARTIRVLGLAELAVGFGVTTGGLLLLSDSAIGIIPAIIGIATIYLGYTDLSASRRFFYPDSLLSEDSMKKELLSRSTFDRQSNPGLVFTLTKAF